VANTYRYYGHSRSDPRVYRTKEEEKFWKDRDPVITFPKKMIENGVFTEEEAKKTDDEVKTEIEEATDYSINSPFPASEELYTDLYA
jgi:pyruvate dehydrogenase E1 component alpha subunit